MSSLPPQDAMADDTLAAATPLATPVTVPRWRLSSPYWIMCYGFLVVLVNGMTSAPKPELFIHLACIAHPPAVSTGDPLGTIPRFELNNFNGTFPKTDSFVSWDDIFVTAPSPFPDLDSERCRHDVGVQRLAARIQMGLVLMSGVLGVVTTGFWGSVSDRVGRCRVIALGQFGVFVAEAALLFIVMHPGLLTRFGAWTLYVGPFIFGLCGGGGTLNTAMSAYLADTVGSGNFAAFLSLVIGVIRAGATVGPIAGTFLITMTNDTLMPFKVALAVQILLMVGILTIVPDSLSAEARERSAKEYSAQREAQNASASSFIQTWTRRALIPFEPLRIFIPKANGSFVRGDYNLFLVALMDFSISLTKGKIDTKSQYAVLALGWTQKQFGPFFSFIELCQVVVLAVLMPLVAHFVQPYLASSNVRQPHGDDEPAEHTPLLQDDANANVNEPRAEDDDARRKRNTLTFDFRLLLICFVIQISGNLALGLNATASSVLFVAASAWIVLGSPLDPCSVGLALALAPADVHPGQLFGALGVVDSLGLHFLSAPLYAGVFTATVGFYPPAIFIVTAVCLTAAAVLATLVRLPRSSRARV